MVKELNLQKIKERGYAQVGIPLNTVVQILKIMEPLGYRTLSEFVNEAVRAHIRFKMTEYDRTILE